MKLAAAWWLLALIPLAISAFYVFRARERRRVHVRYSLAGALKDLPRGPRAAFAQLPLVLRLVAMTCLIVALARPQGALSRETFEAEGIDIVLALDVSGSMKADDFKPNRLTVARRVASEFVEGRPHDRIGFVTFATTAITRSPLTIDQAALRQIIESTGFSNEGSTAIGTALATSVNRLRESDAKSKVIILLTDGQNNAGEVDPLTAAELARTMDIRVYTIGAGSREIPRGLIGRFFGSRPQPVDEDQLTQIAELTGGRYFRAENEEALEQVYEQIGKLEKGKIDADVVRQYREAYVPWALAALLCLLAEFILRRTWLQGLAGV